MLTGQLIGTAKGFVSANVHSPATGTVAKVDVVMDHTGYYKPAVFINREDKDEWAEGIIETDELLTDIKLDAKQIIDKVKECGIVGMGGATFPAHVKLMVPKAKRPNTSSSTLLSVSLTSPATTVCFSKRPRSSSWV